MQRRQFMAYLCGVPAAGYAIITLGGCGAAGIAAVSSTQSGGSHATGKVQSFGYYEGLGAEETRDPGRTDGTAYNMPCITPEDIAASADKEYVFWHGHGGMDHNFTVKAADFAKLKAGQDVELFTSIVEDHRHSLKISMSMPCEAESCR